MDEKFEMTFKLTRKEVGLPACTGLQDVFRAMRHVVHNMHTCTYYVHVLSSSLLLFLGGKITQYCTRL